jgi:hypothetical protein
MSANGTQPKSLSRPMSALRQTSKPGRLLTTLSGHSRRRSKDRGSPSSPIGASVARRRRGFPSAARTALVPSRHVPKRCAGAGLRGRPLAGQQDSGRRPAHSGRLRKSKTENRPGEYPQRGQSPGSIQSVGPGEGQSSKVRRGPSLPPAFRLTFCSGELFCSGAALVPGAHCSHRRTVSWQLSAMRTPVALPPILKRMEQRMPEHRRFTQTISLEESLPEEAKRLRKQAQGTPTGH